MPSFLRAACDANRDRAAIGISNVSNTVTRHLRNAVSDCCQAGARLATNAARPSAGRSAQAARKTFSAKSSCACAVPRAPGMRLVERIAAGSARSSAGSARATRHRCRRDDIGEPDMLGLLRVDAAGPRTAGALRAWRPMRDATNGAICAGGMPSPVSGVENVAGAVRGHHVDAPQRTAAFATALVDRQPSIDH